MNALADILGQAAQSNIVVCDLLHDFLSSLQPDNASTASTSVSDEPLVNSQLDRCNELPTSCSAQLAGSKSVLKRRRFSHEQFHSSLR